MHLQNLDKTSVHRLCSGQVIISLATAVKELVENALDAKATNIEVRLKEFGREYIEVVDNGIGVKPCDFAGLGLKHHTSKLHGFEDLAGVQTFGFRGEAISSLCAVSDVTFITRHESMNTGAIITFNYSGHIVEEKPVAREIGSTVQIHNLFHTLPVRHKELELNIKREFHKLCQTLTSYALSAKSVRLHCTNVNAGKKSVVLSSPAHDEMKHNISTIFGPKQMQSLLPFVQHSPSISICDEFKVKDTSEVFKIEGYISAPNEGRSASDRQFIFVNSRPCHIPKLTRLINETYKCYNKFQLPVIIINIEVASEQVDVNVTPDKLKIFIQHEQYLLAVVKGSLLIMYESTSWRDTTSPLLSQSYLTSSSQTQSPASFKRRFASAFDKRDEKLNSDKLQKMDIFCNKVDLKTCSMDLKSDSAGRVSVSTNYCCSALAEKDCTPNLMTNVKTSRSALKKNQFQQDDINNGVFTVTCYDQQQLRCLQNEVPVQFNLLKLQERLTKRHTLNTACKPIRLFHAQISAQENESAEKELRKQLSKQQFLEMNVIGQFNLGFIVAALDDDLFIIDQHAADEKYNFERLQRETIISSQKLISPQALQLTAANEEILIDNINIFQMNGFDFRLDVTAEATHRVKLTATPFSKNWSFGAQDIDEMIFMLTDSPGQVCRPSKVRAMFASRACRSSIMVGTALNHRQMKTILAHLASLEQPWNCPHGRPTLRHLVNIAKLF